MEATATLTQRTPIESAYRIAAGYGLAFAVSALIVVVIFQLWKADLAVPVGNAGDALYSQMFVKSAVENGSHLRNESLGAPWGQDLHDAPMPDGVHYLLIKALHVFTGNWALTFNLFYFLTYPLVAVTALFALRQFGLGYPVGLGISLLYAFMPYHVFRGCAHYFLSCYYLVPLGVVVVVWVYLGQLPIGGGKNDARKWAAALGVCIATGCGGAYYAYFTCCFLLVAGLAAAIHRRRPAPFGTSLTLVAATTAAMLANLAPAIAYRFEHGPNPDAVVRLPQEAEIYGLKIAQLVLPVRGHRFDALNRVTESYIGTTPLVNENQFATLGVVGSVGFIGLVAMLLFGSRSSAPSVMSGLSLLTGTAILLGTVGGAGAILSLCGGTWIRAYNRISIFIAFFALLAVGLVLQRVADQWARGCWRTIAPAAGMAVFTIVALLDLIPHHIAPKWDRLIRDFENDADFVQRIADRVPKGAMIFELPSMPFAEQPPVNGWSPYELLRPYLHGGGLRWSGNALRGSKSDLWQRRLTSRSTNAQVQELVATGFAGIYLDPGAYADRGAKLAAELTALVGPPLVSADSRALFFDLTADSRRD